jgi:inosine-uridine nucleoside N-ribohydrolase
MECKEIKEKWIIDTDPGCDDIMAILYLVNRPEVEIEFLSLAEGNCVMEDVIRNIKKIFVMYGKNLPVFGGCRHQLYNGAMNAYDYHFQDGLGNIDEIINIDISEIIISSSSSPVEIVKAVNKHPNQINLLCLAPLTNLIAAYMLDPSIVNKFKSIVCMGGSYNWRGNVTSIGEFNFYHDFLSVNVFLSKFKNILVCGWEPTEFLFFNVNNLEKSKSIAIEKFGSYNQNLYKYLYLIIEKYTRKREGTQVCDLYAIIPYFQPKSVKSYFISEVKVIIDSEELRGGLVFKNKTYPKISFEEIFYSYYLKGKEYKKNQNIYIEELEIEQIISEFAYILRPVQ